MPGNLVILYVAYLNNRCLKHGSISVYLAAVRSMHIEAGYPNPLENCLQLPRAVRATKLTSSPPQQKLAITLHCLRLITSKLDFHNYEHILLWAAMTSAYFGLLRKAKFTVRSHASFSFECNLTLNDVNIINTKPFDYMSLSLKDSKTDKSRKGVFIYIGCTDKDVCVLYVLCLSTC